MLPLHSIIKQESSSSSYSVEPADDNRCDGKLVTTELTLSLQKVYSWKQQLCGEKGIIEASNLTAVTASEQPRKQTEQTLNN